MSKNMRIHKTENFSVVSNTHLKDRRLSYKAKGLLTVMLSLPEDWDYTIAGLATLACDGVDSTRKGILELEKYGYVVRTRIRDPSSGKITDVEYDIYEEPLWTEIPSDLPKAEHPVLEKPKQDYPLLGFPMTEEPSLDSGTQLRMKELRTKESSTKQAGETEAVQFADTKADTSESVQRTEKETEALLNEIKATCEYTAIAETSPDRKEQMEYILRLIRRACEEGEETVWISGKAIPAYKFREAVLRLTRAHMEHLLRRMKEARPTSPDKYYLSAIYRVACTPASLLAGRKAEEDRKEQREKTGFHNFREREYDWEKLERQLLFANQ